LDPRGQVLGVLDDLLETGTLDGGEMKDGARMQIRQSRVHQDLAWVRGMMEIILTKHNKDRKVK
jgi:hypothetical protein